VGNTLPAHPAQESTLLQCAVILKVSPITDDLFRYYDNCMNLKIFLLYLYDDMMSVDDPRMGSNTFQTFPAFPLAIKTLSISVN
jgi:hypothetical protein